MGCKSYGVGWVLLRYGLGKIILVLHSGDSDRCMVYK